MIILFYFCSYFTLPPIIERLCQKRQVLFLHYCQNFNLFLTFCYYVPWGNFGGQTTERTLSQCNFYSFLPNLILLVHCLDFYRRVYYIDHNTNAMVATNSNLHFFTLFLSSCSLFCWPLQLYSIHIGIV